MTPNVQDLRLPLLAYPGDPAQRKSPPDRLLKRLFGMVILLNLFYFIGWAMWFV
jgi:hypothetical protein